MVEAAGGQPTAHDDVIVDHVDAVVGALGRDDEQLLGAEQFVGEDGRRRGEARQAHQQVHLGPGRG
jgi:hypothetical protein